MLSILALVDMHDSGQAAAGEEERGCVEEEEILGSRHELLQTLAALVRAWRPRADGDGFAGEGGSIAGDGGVSAEGDGGVEIELLVAASCCRC